MSVERGKPRQNSDASGEPPLLVHDLRHALFALQTGIDLLPRLRDDVEQFEEVHGLLQMEVRKASELLKRVLERRELHRP